MHGGSGSTQEEITTAVKNGVVKMNVDTDTQWAYWDGLRLFYKKNEGYLQVFKTVRKTIIKFNVSKPTPGASWKSRGRG